MRKATHFVDHMTTLAQNRDQGKMLHISDHTWPELNNQEWRHSVIEIICAMHYIPFRTVKFVHDNGHWTVSFSSRPGLHLVDITPQPSIWARIKASISNLY